MPAAPPFLLAFGDSLIAGYGLAPADGLSAQLQRGLARRFPGARVHNAGASGNTTADALRRLPRVLAEMTVRPDLALVQIGANDVLRGVPPVQTRANLDAIVTELARCGIPVLLTTLDPPALVRARAAPYLGLHGEIAARHGAAISGFFPAGILGRADMVLPDRVHPNARAIAAVVAHLLPTIEALLAARSADAA
ncbi:GDSL-type esterase/lipase family protein [Sphingomonas sp.]|jgi:acyl-CoA thioesterase-1|uniref:GDSL-type esterase/lipase family protein n=1 Tax=Sphingomonas sp. TaxID=28214 RepID=UPI00262F52DE|nr:GDSL-type esterase/lipase family protein [Sphingomonas sp.]MDF2493862.1 hypothetical protein [Sphingomonas sp.]